MKLSSLTRRENLFHCDYANRREMASRCRYVWLQYLDTVKTGIPPCDVMIWEIGPIVSVRPASSLLDESSKAFVRPNPIYFELKGFAAKRRKIEQQKNISSDVISNLQAELNGELHSQMKQAILEGFEYRHVIKAHLGFQDDPLTVLMTSRDDGLHQSQFELVWKNKAGPSIESIKKRVSASKGKAFPTNERNPSVRERRLKRIKDENRQWRAGSKKRVALEREKVQKRLPAIRMALLTAIDSQERERQELVRKNARRKGAKATSFLLSLGDGNQFERLAVPNVHVDKLAEIAARYRWTSFDEYDNRMWEYMYQLLDPVRTKFKDRTKLWLNLNRAQKVVYAMLDFIGETDNGGVWQFLFNEPQFSLAALEAMEELDETALASDYQATLEELLGKGNTVAEIRQKANNRKLNDAQRWQAFAEGYGELTSARKIELYFFKSAYKKRLYKRISDYIESHFSLLAEISRE